MTGSWAFLRRRVLRRTVDARTGERMAREVALACETGGMPRAVAEHRAREFLRDLRAGIWRGGPIVWLLGRLAIFIDPDGVEEEMVRQVRRAALESIRGS